MEVTKRGTEILDPAEPIDLTDCSIKAQFRLGKKTAPVTKTAVSGDDIEITDAPAGTFVLFPETIIDWPAGVYYFDVQVTFPDGKITTYVDGTIEILQDVTE